MADTPTETGGFTCDCCGRNMEVRINEKFCNECAGYRSSAAPVVDRALYSELIHIAAELARGGDFLPTCAEDMNRRLRRANILKTAERQDQQLKDWANRVRQVADGLYIAAPPAIPQPSEQLKVYADGYCVRCSELAYPLTRALEKTGVPTGEDNWQQTYGPNRVRALADLETSLRRLLSALNEGKPERIKSEISRADHYIEFHAQVRRRLTASAQAAAPADNERRLRDAIHVAISACKDVTELGRFAKSVDPVGWVAEIQEHLAAALR